MAHRAEPLRWIIKQLFYADVEACADASLAEVVGVAVGTAGIAIVRLGVLAAVAGWHVALLLLRYCEIS